MQAHGPGRLNSTINVTPLVDVVLVLLIIFMVIAPQLAPAPDVEVPETERPPTRADDGPRIEVAVERGGTLRIDGEPVAAADFVPLVRRAAAEQRDARILIRGDRRLGFGDVRQVMLAVESAGFRNVGLITERPDDAVPGS